MKPTLLGAPSPAPSTRPDGRLSDRVRRGPRRFVVGAPVVVRSPVKATRSTLGPRTTNLLKPRRQRRADPCPPSINAVHVPTPRQHEPLLGDRKTTDHRRAVVVGVVHRQEKCTWRRPLKLGAQLLPDVHPPAEQHDFPWIERVDASRAVLAVEDLHGPWPSPSSVRGPGERIHRAPEQVGVPGAGRPRQRHDDRQPHDLRLLPRLHCCCGELAPDGLGLVCCDGRPGVPPLIRAVWCGGLLGCHRATIALGTLF